MVMEITQVKKKKKERHKDQDNSRGSRAELFK